MALWDTAVEKAKSAGTVLGAGAKSAALKAGDALSVAKINAKISDEKRTIDGELLSIGEYYYDRIMSGEVDDENVQLRVDAIQQHKARIEKLEKEKSAALAES